jgi:hypothetical protein
MRLSRVKEAFAGFEDVDFGVCFGVYAFRPGIRVLCNQAKGAVVDGDDVLRCE